MKIPKTVEIIENFKKILNTILSIINVFGKLSKRLRLKLILKVYFELALRKLTMNFSDKCICKILMIMSVPEDNVSWYLLTTS